MTDAAFDCKRCGHCCHGEGGIVLTANDGERLATHLGVSVAEMLERYDLSLADIGSRPTAKSGLSPDGRDIKGMSNHPVKYAGGAIGELTNTQFVYQGRYCLFFGAKADTNLAHAMLLMLRGAMDREWKTWRQTTIAQSILLAHSSAALRQTFMLPMAIRIAGRIYDLAKQKKARVQAASGEAGALVVQHMHEVLASRDAWAAERNIKIGEADTTKKTDKLQKNMKESELLGYTARRGYEAGGRVPITGVTGTDATKKLTET